MKDVFRYEDVTFFTNDTIVSGIISLDGSYSFNTTEVKGLGYGFIDDIFESQTLGQFNLTKNYINNDIFYGFIQSGSLVSGSFHYDTKNFGFESGYITDYNVNASIGQIPTTNSSITAYGNFGYNIDNSGNLLDHPVSIVTPRGINLIVNDIEKSGFIQSFEYSLSMNWNPIYGMNQVEPLEVKFVPPIVCDLSVTFNPKQYEGLQIEDLYCQEKLNLIINMNACDGTLIKQYICSGAKIYGESNNIAIQSRLENTINFRGYFTGLEELP